MDNQLFTNLYLIASREMRYLAISLYIYIEGVGYTSLIIAIAPFEKNHVYQESLFKLEGVSFIQIDSQECMGQMSTNEKHISEQSDMHTSIEARGQVLENFDLIRASLAHMIENTVKIQWGYKFKPEDTELLTQVLGEQLNYPKFLLTLQNLSVRATQIQLNTGIASSTRVTASVNRL